jgi:hypothetical protein
MGSMQGLAIAISPDGINYFAQVLVADVILQAIQSVDLANSVITPPSILLYSGQYSSEWAQNINITLSGGKLSSFNPQFQSVTQNASGNFSLVFVANNCSATYSWHETYNDVMYSGFSHNTISSPSNTYGYSLGIGNLTITVPMTLAATSGGGYQLDVGTVSAVPSNLSPNVPSKSVVNQYSGLPCLHSTVDSATTRSIENVNFSQPIQSSINPLFGTIPDSGTLLPSPTQVVYEYGVGINGLSFPNNQGLTLGVTGQVTYQGTPYSGQAAPDVQVPSMPSTQHVHFNLADYEFNALYWAFYSAGALKTDVVPGDLPDPALLNTATYKGTYLQALYNAYPSVPMSVNVNATSSPTLHFEQVYILTNAAFTTLGQQGVPATVLTPLKFLKNQVFDQQTTFVTDVEKHSPNSTPYIQQIETAAQVYGAMVTHDVQCVFNVVPTSTPVEAFTVQFNETEFLYDLALNVYPPNANPSKQAQTVQFAFQLIPSATSAKLVNSNISGITSSNFPMMWNIVLQPEYADELAKMGQTGVPVPFIQGFEFLFEQAVVQVEAGYVDVLANAQYKGAGVAQLAKAKTA